MSDEIDNGSSSVQNYMDVLFNQNHIKGFQSTEQHNKRQKYINKLPEEAAASIDTSWPYSAQEVNSTKLLKTQHLWKLMKTTRSF